MFAQSSKDKMSHRNEQIISKKKMVLVSQSIHAFTGFIIATKQASIKLYTPKIIVEIKLMSPIKHVHLPLQ